MAQYIRKFTAAAVNSMAGVVADIFGFQSKAFRNF